MFPRLASVAQDYQEERPERALPRARRRSTRVRSRFAPPDLVAPGSLVLAGSFVLAESFVPAEHFVPAAEGFVPAAESFVPAGGVVPGRRPVPPGEVAPAACAGGRSAG